MNKKTLKYIKNDMWEVLYNKKYVQAGLKAELKELEADRKRVLAGYAKSEDKLFRTVSSIMVNERYDRLRVETIQNQIAGWHSDQSYYLIYQDRSEVCITAEDILNGEKFPSMSNIVYAELQSADEHIDTERGELNWYSEEVLEACDYNYEVEDNRKWQYEAAIQFKFDTVWSRRYKKKNPDFIPLNI